MPWSEKKAADWYAGLAPLRGVNYVPSYASNMIEWWQEATWDEAVVEREIGFAAASGLNSIRCNLHVFVWERQREALHRHLEALLRLSAARGVSVVLCLFDDCNFSGDTECSLGPQRPPLPGVHNGRWISSPLPFQVADRGYWHVLEEYTRDVIRTHARDSRILLWDLYNEPGNMGLADASLPLLEACFSWAREEHPEQPLTSGVYKENGLKSRILALSDIITFHSYETAEITEEVIWKMRAYRRPIICTETIRRATGKTFRDMLPVFSRHGVGWYSWGLVAGRQQTYLPWEVRNMSINDPWHWDLLHPDGSPYDPGEISLIKGFTYERESR